MGASGRGRSRGGPRDAAPPLASLGRRGRVGSAPSRSPAQARLQRRERQIPPPAAREGGAERGEVGRRDPEAFKGIGPHPCCPLGAHGTAAWHCCHHALKAAFSEEAPRAARTLISSLCPPPSTAPRSPRRVERWESK